MHITRRAALFGTVSGLSALAACSLTGTSTTPAQIVADANGLVNLLVTDIPIFSAIDPNLIPASKQTSVLTELQIAQGLLVPISATTVALSSATTLQTVDGYINDALDVVSAIATVAATSPLAPYALLIQAAIALAPGIEAFVNSTLGLASAKATLRAKAVAPAMTPAQARTLLGIQTVG